MKFLIEEIDYILINRYRISRRKTINNNINKRNNNDIRYMVRYRNIYCFSLFTSV